MSLGLGARRGFESHTIRAESFLRLIPLFMEHLIGPSKNNIHFLLLPFFQSLIINRPRCFFTTTFCFPFPDYAFRLRRAGTQSRIIKLRPLSLTVTFCFSRHLSWSKNSTGKVMPRERPMVVIFLIFLCLLVLCATGMYFGMYQVGRP